MVKAEAKFNFEVAWALLGTAIIVIAMPGMRSRCFFFQLLTQR